MSLKDINISTWPGLGYNYWGITKCGSTTVKTHLYQLETGNVFENKKHTKIHGEVDYITQEQALSNGLLNFATTRNPYDRFLSMYSDMVLSRPKRGIKAGVSPEMSVNDLLDFIQGTDDLDVHFKKQTDFIPNRGMLIIDIKQLGNWPLPLTPITLKKHTSKIKHIGLNQLQKERVYLLYQDDFEKLGYSK